VLHIDPDRKVATYLPIATKLALLKKKRMQLEPDDEERYLKLMQTITPGFMMLAPRALTTKEAQK